MAASNTFPQFTKNGVTSGVRVTTANTSSDGDSTIGTNSFLVYTADATNGSFIGRVRVMVTSTVAATASQATVIRIFLSTQASGATTNANTKLIGEITLPAVTAASATVATTPFELELNMRVAASTTILATTHTVNTTNTAWHVSLVDSGDY